MFTRLNARKIVAGLIATIVIGGHVVLIGGAGAATLKIDFTAGGSSGTLQAGYQEFSHDVDGGAMVTKPLTSELGIGGTVDVSISGNTHWRSYGEADGMFASQSDLLRDGPLCNGPCTMTLGLGNLASGTYEITTYHHTTFFGPNEKILDLFDIALTDSVLTDSIVVAGIEESDNASSGLSTATFQFTVSGGSPVEIDLLRTVNTEGMHITLAAVNIQRVGVLIPEPSSIVLLMIGLISFLSLSQRRPRRRPA